MHSLLDSISHHRAALAMERRLPRAWQDRLRYMFAGIAFLTGVVAFALTAVLPNHPAATLLFGVSMVSMAMWLEQIMIYSFHNYHYYFGLNSIIGIEDEPVSGCTYEVAKCVIGNESDVTRAFLTSRLGQMILRRAGVDMTKLEAYLGGQRPLIAANMIAFKDSEVFTLQSLGDRLMAQDPTLKNFFKEQGITEDSYHGATDWVVSSYLGRKRTARWWSRDNLSRMRGIGREMSYGRAYALERYARDIRTSAVFSTFASNTPYAEEKVGEIEETLARAKAANVLIVGEAGVGKMDLVIEVAKRMMNGKALDAISGKHIVVLDTDRLIALNREKQDLELAIIKLFDEALKAGNLIIAIENISRFIKEGAAMDVQVPEVIDKYLASPEINVIATDTPGAFHAELQPLGAFVRRFSEVLVEPTDLRSTVNLLQGVAEKHERKHRTLFTYPAVAAVAKCADQYLVEGVMPDKAIGLVLEVAAHAGSQCLPVITPEIVYSYVSEKTGIPAGPIQDEEREKLLNLEKVLHQRVIGQESALTAIAKTMRRARAGIQQSDKPIGSFLFLGPTGVGKTETAKALAHTFFGSEENMERIDMSEFSGPDALSRLIGDGEGDPGVLPTMLTEHPYTVLLLDEFEKAVTQVHDLFLQILDEGIFTDARGNRINARNTIIIATSNAGSQLIMKTVEQRQELSTLHDAIIDHIVAEGIYRPELINRFDSTIIFEPLTREEQGSVASLMLGGLYERIRERGYELELSRDLIDVMVEKGYDPEFGARPMQRVMQDLIEEKVAQKIIAGEVNKGDTITLSKADFLDVELAA